MTMLSKTPVPDSVSGWAKENGFDISDIDSCVYNSMTALMTAAMQGEPDIVCALLAAGADTRLLNDDMNNVLWFACVSNNTYIIEEILRYGCDIDNQNVNGATCLIYASSSGKLDIVKQLVQSGADTGRKTLDGFDALDSAATLPTLKFLQTCSLRGRQSIIKGMIHEHRRKDKKTAR